MFWVGVPWLVGEVRIGWATKMYAYMWNGHGAQSKVEKILFVLWWCTKGAMTSDGSVKGFNVWKLCFVVDREYMSVYMLRCCENEACVSVASLR